MTKTQSLTTGNLPSQIRSIAIPSSIGFFFHTMYNVVDSIFAGQISTEALAAMGLCFPIFFIIIALSPGFGTAVSVLVGNALGAKEIRKSECNAQQALGFGFCISIILMLVGVFASKPLLQFIGGEGEVLRLALEYIQIIYWGALAFIIFSFCNNILTAHGDSKPFRNMLVLGFFLNLILDPLFLYGGFGIPAMGFKGIALATVVIESITALFLFGLCLHRGYFGIFRLKHVIPKPKFIQEMLIQGIPASLNMLMVAFGFFVTNYFVKDFGNEAIAMFGVTTRIEQIILLPTIGISVAVSAIVAQNNGAGNIERIKETLRIGSLWGLYLIIPASIIMALGGKWWMGIFSDDSAVIALGITYLWIMLTTEWSYVIGGIYIGALQAMKKPFLGFIAPLLRIVLGRLVFFSVCIYVLHLGLNSLWWSIVILNTIVTVFAIWYTRRAISRMG